MFFLARRNGFDDYVSSPFGRTSCVYRRCAPRLNRAWRITDLVVEIVVLRAGHVRKGVEPIYDLASLGLPFKHSGDSFDSTLLFRQLELTYKKLLLMRKWPQLVRHCLVQKDFEQVHNGAQNLWRPHRHAAIRRSLCSRFNLARS